MSLLRPIETYDSAIARMNPEHAAIYARLHRECDRQNERRVNAQRNYTAANRKRKRCKVGGEAYQAHSATMAWERAIIESAQAAHREADDARRSFDNALTRAEGFHYASRAWEIGRVLAESGS